MKKRNNMIGNLKAQASLELLVTFGVIIAFIVPVLLLLLSVTQLQYESTSIAQAEAGARILADNIEELNSQGEPAKRTVFLNLPPNSKELIVQKNEIIVNTSTSTGFYEAVEPFYGSLKSAPYTIRKNGLFSVMIIKTKQGVDVVAN